jgi:hypothetical chaperone protein
VIGRPVNFQGLAGEESNRQAIAILSEAARLAGFERVEFLYEPVAAGFEFERASPRMRWCWWWTSGRDHRLPVLRMGPSHRDQLDRSGDLLGHSGQRIGATTSTSA